MTDLENLLKFDEELGMTSTVIIGNSSTYTYLISSGIGREALIIDPVLENTDQYIDLLSELKLKLVILVLV